MINEFHRVASQRARFLKAGLIILIVLAHAGAWAIEPGCADDRLARRLVFAMGTWLNVEVRAPSIDTALQAAEVVIEAVEAAERRLSTWVPSSELTRINRTPVGVWSPLSARLGRDLEAAWQWEQTTGGAFSPRIGPLIEAWDLRNGGRVPSVGERRRAFDLADRALLELRDGRLRRLDEGAWIEEGAFGKGAALRDATLAAQAAGASCVVLDFGGQVAVAGDCESVRVAVADPDDRQSEIAVLSLTGGSAATSGNSERGLLIGDRRFGHLIDPRSGLPAPDWGSVTAVADNPFAADCVATALYVMGPRRGAEWLRSQRGLDAVFVERNADDVKITASSGLRGRLSTTGGRPVTWLAEKDGEIECRRLPNVSDPEGNTGRPVRKDFR
jgi:thiamine biosynthesis lipoprotein